MEEEFEVCCVCGKQLEEDDKNEVNDKLYCNDCYDDLVECDGCGEYFPSDELTWWGDSRLCPDCLEEECPSFDEEKNEQDTQAVYDEMKETYIGSKTIYGEKKSLDFSWNAEYDETKSYNVSVEIDVEGRISDISRVKCNMMFSEWESGSDWRPCEVDEDDYETFIDDYLSPILAEDEV